MSADLNRLARRGAPLLAVVSLFSGSADAIDLCATTGTVTLPDGVTRPIWGYVLNGDGEGCTGVSGTARLPGPPLRTTNGSNVTINLTNDLGVPTSILIPGQTLTATGGNAGQFTQEAAPGGGTASYTFTAETGTYLYEGGTPIEVAMGLYGALIVESGLTVPSGPNAGQPTAYSLDRTRYTSEAVLVLSEIDPALNANPSGFDLQDYAPVYWLINGKAYPDTDSVLASGDRLLLRYLNASNNHHSMSLLGAHQQIIARESFELPTPIDAVAETIPAGSTADMIVPIPAATPPLTLWPLYNRNARLTNASSNAEGGMQTAVEIQPLFFSTAGSGVAVPGVPPGTGASAHDDADIYKWNGRKFTRVFEGEVTGGGAANLPAGANVDGLKVADADTFYVSFTASVAVPGLGTVDDADIVLFDAGTWTLYFNSADPAGNGTLPLDAAVDIDAFDISAGGVLYFSTLDDSAIPGVPSVPLDPLPYDDADIYRWNGTSFARVFDARVSLVGLPAAADIDGLKVVTDSGSILTDFYMSFAEDTAVPGTPALTVQDEDIVRRTGLLTNTLFLNATAIGLGPAALDIDAMDLPR